MNLRRLLPCLSMVALALSAWLHPGFVQVGSAEQATAEASEPKAPDGKAAGDKGPSKESGQDSFAMRYAKLQLRLAELTLQKAREMNRRMPQTLAPGMVEQFSDDVDFAKKQVEYATQHGEVDSFNVWIHQAEIDVRIQESRLKRIQNAARISKEAAQPIDIERVRLSVDIAKLRAERGRSLVSASPDERLRWQMEMISEQMRRLDNMVTLSLQNRLSEFF
jgi:hypothetical protein